MELNINSNGLDNLASNARTLVDSWRFTADDVRALDVDFMGFSSHKMFGPNGVGSNRYGSIAWI